MKKISVNIPGNPYPVYIGRNALKILPRLAGKYNLSKRGFLLTDSYVKKLFGAGILKIFKNAGWEIKTFALPRGEKAKEHSVIQKLYEFLFRFRAERATPVFAMGGGAVLDSAGFVAGTYYRGLPLVNIPTTLLSQVDGAIGGKCAINYKGIKNTIGVFYQPRFVLCDAALIRTLTEREFFSGIAEVFKYAISLDKNLFCFIERNKEKILRRDLRKLEFLVEKSVRMKAGVVSKDERDMKGIREILNFGHTVGHAIEAEGKGKILHGEAVSAGMKVAVHIARARKILSESDARRMFDIFSILPRANFRLSPHRILRALRYDKKMKDAKNIFILPVRIGETVRANDVSAREIFNAFKLL